MIEVVTLIMASVAGELQHYLDLGRSSDLIGAGAFKTARLAVGPN